MSVKNFKTQKWSFFKSYLYNIENQKGSGTSATELTHYYYSMAKTTCGQNFYMEIYI